MLTINKANFEDRDIYIKLASKLYCSDAVDHSIDSSNFKKTFDYLHENNTYGQIYIIKFNEEIVGYTLISKTFSQEVAGMVLLIEEIFIIDKYRDLGIGKGVFEYLENEYNGYKRIRLELTNSNIKAKKLYENLGFSCLEYIQMIKDKI